MKKKKKKKKSAGSAGRKRYETDVAPEFKRHIEKMGEQIIDFSGAPKELRLSDSIFQLIEPYMESVDVNLLVDCATVAWNECVKEDFDIEDSYYLNNMLLDFSQYRNLIDKLKLRKRLMFKNSSRHIKQVKVYQKGDDISINVASTMNILDIFSNALGLENEPSERYIEADDEVYSNMESCDNDSGISAPNPRLKRILLEVVSNQINDNDPPAVRETFERLKSEGYTSREAKEKIAAILAEDIYEVLKTKKPPNEAAYQKKIRALN